MITMDAAAKPITLRRELTLYELVIPDLKQVEAAGKFDVNVLLWLQDAYVSRAMKENTGELLSFHRELSRTDTSEAERWNRKAEFLTKITKQTYSTAKAEGGGFDLKQYVDAARTFYESESVLYAGQLAELAEYIKKSLESGVKPDIERFAGESYVSMARMSGAIQSLENIGARQNAERVAQMMKMGINRIGYSAVTTPDQPQGVGRELLKLVEKISSAPDKYIQFVNPHKLRMQEARPWDFEPVHRSDSSLVM